MRSGLSPRGQGYGIGITATLFSTPALAEVCDKVRPLWQPGTQATALTEALHFFATPLGLILVALSAVAIARRWQWVGLATILGWTGLVSLVALGASIDPTSVHALAVAEGCVGPPTLFIVAVAAICVGIVLWTKPRTSGADGSES
ncbi:hypothetical protein [uncultured Tateyamaria sp.]|uniref:hypothetical protein n=1 Tax=uncultured Tateyamaria sp. TaxID=455651 RepID=UPI0026052C54|nr:hypothetical protein [uncultured Tateyamaria sp.]